MSRAVGCVRSIPSSWRPAVLLRLSGPLATAIMSYSWLSIIFFLAAAPLTNLVTPPAPFWGDLQVKHMWDAIPTNWESLGHPPADTTIDLHIALKPHREGALIDALYEVSDPSLPKYGAHLSREQVAELVAPHPDTLGLVHSWLEHGGVFPSSSMTHGGGWLTVTSVPVSQANDLLGASYQLYRHTSTNKTILRTIGYALPMALHAHVLTVEPTTYFSPPHTLQQIPHKRFREKAAENTTSVASRDEGDVTPELLRSLYNTVAYVPAATDRNKLGVAGYLGQSPRQEDLTKFMSRYRSDAEDATFTVVEVNNGKYDPNPPGQEASMNIQYAEALAYPTPHIFYSIGGLNQWYQSTKQPTPDDTDFVWLKYLISLPNSQIPQTITISYGKPEKDIPQEYAKTICDLFAQLGTRGVSILFASGDDGVGKGDCKNEKGKVKFIPVFPASCPWVTSVGGTTRHGPEVALSISGGGFSFYFPRPKYQKRAVYAFRKHLGRRKYAGSYNRGGRGIPDISAQALNFLFVIKPELLAMSGTSCSAPTAAGVISLLNDYLLMGGKAPLGFLNIWLYGIGLPGLNDITSGSNPGCNTDGFPAVVGWDPVTGLGTPDFIKLQRTLADRPVVSSIAVTTQSSTPSTQRAQRP